MRKTVAIVSSTLALSELLADLVRQSGLEARVLAGGADLVAYMRAQPVQVVVVDTELEGGNALSLVRALRAKPDLVSSTFAVLALTRAAPEFHGRLLAAGADAVLPKPVRANQFVARIGTLAEPTPLGDNVVQLFAARRQMKSA